MPWEELSKDEKIHQLIDALTVTAVGAVNAPLANGYEDAKSRITDMADRMRLDLQWWEAIQPLRDIGAIPTGEEIHAKAESMVDMSSDEMRKALADYHREVRSKYQSKKEQA